MNWWSWARLERRPFLAARTTSRLAEVSAWSGALHEGHGQLTRATMKRRCVHFVMNRCMRASKGRVVEWSGGSDRSRGLRQLDGAECVRRSTTPPRRGPLRAIRGRDAAVTAGGSPEGAAPATEPRGRSRGGPRSDRQDAWPATHPLPPMGEPLPGGILAVHADRPGPAARPPDADAAWSWSRRTCRPGRRLLYAVGDAA